MDTLLTYITTQDINEARRIGKCLVEERLAACVNILDPVESIYWWEGEIQNSKESILIAKTISSEAKKLEERVKKLHSYANPCIVFYKAEQGSANFLNWINDSIRGEKHER